MGAQNQFSGKLEEGLFKGGQGPVKGIEVVREGEKSANLNPDTSGHNLKTVGGKGGEGLVGSPNDKAFDMYSKPYAGPGNLEFKPKDMGDVGFKKK